MYMKTGWTNERYFISYFYSSFYHIILWILSLYCTTYYIFMTLIIWYDICFGQSAAVLEKVISFLLDLLLLWQECAVIDWTFKQNCNWIMIVINHYMSVVYMEYIISCNRAHYSKDKYHLDGKINTICHQIGVGE